MSLNLNMRNKGLSLIEIIVSLILLSSVMAGIAGIFFAGKRHVMHARDRMASGELGKSFLDPMQMQVRQDTWDSVGNSLTPNTTPVTSPAVKVDTVDYTPQYDVKAVTSKDLRKVKVKINWTEF